MSHPVPSHDYSEQHKEETNKEYAKRVRAGSKKKSMAKKMGLVGKLKHLVKESEHLRKHPFGGGKDDPHQDDNGYDQLAQR